MSPTRNRIITTIPDHYKKARTLTPHVPHRHRELFPVPAVFSVMDLGHDLLDLVESGTGVTLHEVLRHAVPAFLGYLPLNAPGFDLVKPDIYGQLVDLGITKEPWGVPPRCEYWIKVKGLDFECVQRVNHGGKGEGSVSVCGCRKKNCYEGRKLKTASLRVHVGREAFNCGPGEKPEVDSGAATAHCIKSQISAFSLPVHIKPPGPIDP
jgi:hypothetical protein